MIMVTLDDLPREVQAAILSLEVLKKQQQLTLHKTTRDIYDIKKAAGMCVCEGWNGHDQDCPDWEMPF
jgi:hypothetical protein